MWDDPMQMYSICPKQSFMIPEIQNMQPGKEDMEQLGQQSRILTIQKPYLPTLSIKMTKN